MTVTAAERRNARTILDRLRRRYPEIQTALEFANPWQLLVSTVLSAQTTDDAVNRATPLLFQRWPNPYSLAAADPEAVEEVVHSTGFFRQKRGRSSTSPPTWSSASGVRCQRIWRAW